LQDLGPISPDGRWVAAIDRSGAFNHPVEGGEALLFSFQPVACGYVCFFTQRGPSTRPEGRPP
jgi:hypothetical protein